MFYAKSIHVVFVVSRLDDFKIQNVTSLLSLISMLFSKYIENHMPYILKYKFLYL